jgi:tetratricopeptide (TPR) repeat protein
MREKVGLFILGAVITTLVIVGLYQIPPIHNMLEWRLDAAAGFVRAWLHPGDTLSPPEGADVALITLTGLSPTNTPTFELEVTLDPSPTPTPLPENVVLESPSWEKQDWNNCGPATLALHLRYYGWFGDQFDISDLLKPDRGDKNVNIEELVYYVRTQAGWLNAEYRVDGTIEDLRRFLAAGYPVMIEKGYWIVSDGPDNGWAGHYALVTGYDASRQAFLIQDTFIGPDQWVDYAVLEEGWQAFNQVYVVVYPVDDQAVIEQLLGEDLDPDANRQAAINSARESIESDPDNPYAWFNLGTNLLYFERYGEAAQAYDQALGLGLPWRFTRYQFGPYIAYFNQGRFNDVIQLADETLDRTPKAEESLLWRGWARYRLGDREGAVADFRAALEINPNYIDAQFALEFLGLSS